MTEVLEDSINTGMIFSMRETGMETFVEYVKTFGFGKYTGIELDTEAVGTIDSLAAPAEIYTLVHPTTQSLVEVACGRVYHLNVVLRTTSGTGSASRVELERVRVVLDQSGIKRVERVYPGEAVTDVEAAGLDEMGDSPDLV